MSVGPTADDDGLDVSGWLLPCEGCREAEGLLEFEGCGDHLCPDCWGEGERFCQECMGESLGDRPIHTVRGRSELPVKAARPSTSGGLEAG